jgi:DNA-binding transcriptional MerR regulator
MKEPTNKKLLPTRALCERYHVVSRTIDRWEAAGVIPAPVRINGRRYWSEAELEARERSSMSNTTTSTEVTV